MTDRANSLPVTLHVNGREISAEVDSRRILSEFLRDDQQLTGTHVGCAHGACGACTVMVDDVAMRSCLMLACQADGAQIRTVESLTPEDAPLSRLQDAFRRNHALQCGFCTPGMLMSATALLEQNPKPTEPEIVEAMCGNLCRCTGYAPIIAAVKEAAGV